MISVLAVYENGVLRPKEPLALADGQEVQLTIYPRPPFLPLRTPTPEEEDYARRLAAAKTLQELFAVMETAPPLPEGYDLCKALNENRKATGERLLYPEPESEANP
jgi:predicted DNA-binding antitoxin AbrB/MazE fold protein